MQLTIPVINIEKFFKVCAFRNTTPKDIGVKKTKFNQYLKFKVFLFGDFIKAESIAIFYDVLTNAIFSKIISERNLDRCKDLPFNYDIFTEFMNKIHKKISRTSCKNLLTLLQKLNLIEKIPVIKKIAGKSENERDINQILYAIWKSTNTLTVKSLNSKFKNHPRFHKINDYILDLWVKNKINIKKIDVPREICQKYGIKDIPSDLVKKYKSVEIYRKRETGESKARLILKNSFKIYPLYGSEIS